MTTLDELLGTGGDGDGDGFGGDDGFVAWQNGLKASSHISCAREVYP